MRSTYDYDSLDEKRQQKIADMVKKDNLDTINQDIVLPAIEFGFYAKYGKRVIDIVISLIVLGNL